MIANSFKYKEQNIQEWIEQDIPNPIEILQKISEVSQTHISILSVIIEELKSLPNFDEEPETNIFETVVSEISHIKLKIMSKETEILPLDDQISKLELELETVMDENRGVREKYEDTRNMVSKMVREYEIGDEQNPVRKDKDVIESDKKEEKQQFYSQCGEYNHLVGQIRSLTNKIDGNRKELQKYTSLAASKQLDLKK